MISATVYTRDTHVHKYHIAQISQTIINYNIYIYSAQPCEVLHNYIPPIKAQREN